jgi:pilus assembly protein Flp/PilA
MTYRDGASAAGALSASSRTRSAVRRKEVKFMSIRSRFQGLIAFLRYEERGQGLAEYALILALIAIVAIVALIFMGSQVSDKLSVIGSQLKSVGG